MIFSLAEKIEREKEHVTVACVVSAGGSEDDDSGEALTITVVIISTSSNARAKKNEEREELIITFSCRRQRWTMESEQHPPPSSSTLLSHQHDFSSLVSWPDHWQPESFEIITSNTSNLPSDMTQVVPEHVARAKLSDGGNNNNNNNSRKENNSTQKTRPQRSNSATLSTISVTCETDTSVKSSRSHPQASSSKQSSIMFNTTNNIATSHSTSALTNVSTIPPASFHNHHQQQRKTSISASSDMNIVHEKVNLIASASTMSIPNKHLIKTTTGATGGPLASTKSLSIKHKSTSFDDHRSTRGIGKSVLEHLVFVFPENVRRILAGPKK